ncbi:MAG: hypothetical protein SFV52_14105 [Saprospiraceae bacterium]|nr:hypothetical protein [Saprospiraceae bacterium]
MEDNLLKTTFTTNGPGPAAKGPSAEYSGGALLWLNASPTPPDVADLFSLNDDDDFAVRCIKVLPDNKPFTLELTTAHASAGWINHFFFEARNREKVFGTRNLGIGYPMVVGAVGSTPVTAPLWVYQVSLEPDAQHPEKWSVVRHERHRVLPNYPLLHLIDRQYATEFSKRAQLLAEGQNLTARQLLDFTEQVQHMLNFESEGLPLGIQPFPEQPSLSERGRIRWAAVAGIFPTLPRTTLTEPPVVAPNLASDVEWKHAFSLLPLDPSQRSTLIATQRNALTAVVGASGSGKTYLISALIINALSNGKKCLVVSKSINALRRAQKFVIEKGFGDLSFILRDLHSDHLMLADMLRAAADNKTLARFDDDGYKTLLNKALREQRKLDNAWEELHTPIFGDQHFSALVGRFLHANRREGKELLVSQLNPADFAFNLDEFERITKAISTSRPLFERFPTLQHPLSNLNSAVFLEHETVAGLKWTENQVELLLQKATQVFHRYISKTNDYTEALLEHFEQHFTDLSTLIKRIRDAFEDGQHRFGVDFEKPASVTEKLYGVFSERYKMIVQAKEKLVSDFETLRKAHQQYKYFEFDIPAGFDARNIKKVAELTKDLEASLRLWRRRIPALVREEVRRLNAKSIHGDLDFGEQIKELEYAMDVFLEEFNTSGLYDAPLRHEMLTIPKRQEFLEEMIARLEDTRFYLRDYPDFYIWQKHWLGLKPTEQKVVRALCKIKPNDWVCAFESWYLHHLLQNEYQPGLEWDDNTLHNFYESIRQLGNIAPEQISAQWQNRKARALRELKSANSTAYKTWFGKNNRTLSTAEKIDELFRNHMHTLTETLPVLLVTPDVALDVVQYSGITYDLVLVDEAHNIPKQESFHLFQMAKNLVVLGDPKQDMTPFAEDDLLEFASGLNAPVVRLEYQHHHAPEEWVLFNQIAFNTPFKRIPTGLSAAEVTTVANVGGRYDETTQTNEAEAAQIIDWLNLIEQTPAKTYPAVGIACATVSQRDLIAGQLLRIRQRKMPGWEKIQQLHLNGLGVYQFSELQGQHVDVLMISLTHGTTDARGALTQHLHFWNSTLGFNQLHVALTRATQRVFIAHSIPPGLHTVLAADKSHLGTCVLSHLVTYADLVQHRETEAAEKQLQQMKALLHYAENRFPESQFMEEVCFALKPYYESGRLRRNVNVAGILAPLAVEAPHMNVLLEDGVLTPAGIPSYEWEQRVVRHFRKLGVEAVPVYAVQWWKSPKQEARRLAGKLIRKETEEHASPSGGKNETGQGA